MAKLQENVYVPDPETGRMIYYRRGDEIDPSLVNNPNLFAEESDEEEPARLAGEDPLAEEQRGDTESSDEEPSEETPPSDGLYDMTVADLHELADEEEIDLAGAERKDDIVTRIREARA